MDEVPLEGLGAERAMGGPTVLVVDDEPLVANTLALILKRAGYNALCAYDGPTALEIATSQSPDLLISDVAMPVMNGVELALGIVSMTPECKVVLFSGHARSVDLVRAYDAGHNFPLMSKPVHPSEMLAQVARSLQRAAA